jgi:predicted ester cyclase
MLIAAKSQKDPLITPLAGESERRSPFMSEANKDLVRRSWATDSTDVLDEVYTPDAVWHLPEQDVQGVEAFKQYVGRFINALPDANVTVDDEIAEGDKVVERFTLRGTHQGESEEFGPPTGRQTELKGMTISRIEGGKIVEEWQSYANSSMMEQLGLAPEQQ